MRRSFAVALGAMTVLAAGAAPASAAKGEAGRLEVVAAEVTIKVVAPRGAQLARRANWERGDDFCGGVGGQQYIAQLRGGALVAGGKPYVCANGPESTRRGFVVVRGHRVGLYRTIGGYSPEWSLAWREGGASYWLTAPTKPVLLRLAARLDVVAGDTVLESKLVEAQDALELERQRADQLQQEVDRLSTAPVSVEAAIAAAPAATLWGWIAAVSHRIQALGDQTYSSTYFRGTVIESYDFTRSIG